MQGERWATEVPQENQPLAGFSRWVVISWSGMLDRLAVYESD